MQVGTEILLARMKEYPEEFLDIRKGLKWDRVLMDARSCLPSDEIAALDAMLKQLNIDRFNEDVLRTLAGEEQPENLKYKASERYSTGWTDPRVVLGPTTQAERDWQERQRMMGAALQNSAAQMGQNSAAQNTALGMPSGLMNGSSFFSGLFK